MEKGKKKGGEGEMEIYASEGVMYVPYCGEWIPGSNRLVSVGGFGPVSQQVGRMSFHSLKEGKINPIFDVEKAFPFRCCSTGGNRLHVATGDFSGRVEVWDIERVEVPLFSVKGHQEIVNAMAICENGGGSGEISSVSRDGVCNVWDIRQETPVSSFSFAGESIGGKPKDLWSTCFGGTKKQGDLGIYVGTSTGEVIFFDLRMNMPRWEVGVGGGEGGGVCAMGYDEERKRLGVGTKSKVVLYDFLKSENPQKESFSATQTPGEMTVWGGKFAPNHQFITSNQHGDLHLYSGELEEKASKNISKVPLLSLSLSTQLPGLCFCTSLDQTLRVVTIPSLL